MNLRAIYRAARSIVATIMLPHAHEAGRRQGWQEAAEVYETETQRAHARGWLEGVAGRTRYVAGEVVQ
jgi:hypothetical protein